MADEVHGHDLRRAQEAESRTRSLDRKRLLRRVYAEWFVALLSPPVASDRATIVEIGAAGDGIKKFAPNALCSDVLPSRTIDFVADAVRLPLRNHCVDRLVMINTFHHLGDPPAFLREVSRCLKSDGDVVMIEPYNTACGRWVWTHLHHEDFQPSAGEWCADRHDPLMDANGALPWIVFERDRARFEREFPDLDVDRITTHTWVAYLLSGGFSHVQLVPGFLAEFVVAVDKALCRLFPQLGLFATIRLTRRKRPSASESIGRDEPQQATA